MTYIGLITLLWKDASLTVANITHQQRPSGVAFFVCLRKLSHLDATRGEWLKAEGELKVSRKKMWIIFETLFS